MLVSRSPYAHPAALAALGNYFPARIPTIHRRRIESAATAWCSRGSASAAVNQRGCCERVPWIAVATCWRDCVL